MTQLLGSKGLLGYIDGKIPASQTVPTTSGSSSTPDATPIYSTSPSPDEWNFRDQLARGHITLNCIDVAGLRVKTTGTAKEAWDSIQAEWGKSMDMRCSHAQEALNKTVYAEGTSVQEHIKLLRTRRAAVDNLSTDPMSDEAWRGILIRSIPPTARWLPVIPSLYTLASSADIVSNLLAHGMILDRENKEKPTSGISNTALVARGTEACTNPNCKAKKRSTHTLSNCYWPGGGKEGQFPPNFGQRLKANAASVAPSATTDHFVLSAWVYDRPSDEGPGILIDNLDEVIVDVERSSKAFISRAFGNFGSTEIPTFMDSGASDTMFVSKESFSEYRTTPVRTGDSAKADDGAFEIVGEGRVTQRYMVDGKEKQVTYTRALHTPTLNANLISVSAFDEAGLTITFGGGRGVVRQADGSVILTGRKERGMYVVDTVTGDVTPNHPMAMSSISQPTSLEQWHRRLAHCSPTTIQEMKKAGLVDGLNVTQKDL